MDVGLGPRPVEELVRSAELVSGRRIDVAGNLVPLDAATAKDAWHKMPSRKPWTYNAAAVEVDRPGSPRPSAGRRLLARVFRVFF